MSTGAKASLPARVVMFRIGKHRWGIEVAERTQAVLVAVQFAMLALVSVVALVKVFGHHAGPQAVMPQWNWLFSPGLSAAAVAHGAILCVFAYWGWDACLSISEETQQPHKNPGKAAVLATILMLGSHVLVSFAIQTATKDIDISRTTVLAKLALS